MERNGLETVTLFERFASRPPASADRALDIAEDCFVRFGIERTTMTDIAREMKVARTTLYRQFSSIEDALAMVSARYFYRFLDEMGALFTSPTSADELIGAIAATARWVRALPVVGRTLTGEPELLGKSIMQAPEWWHQVAEALTPMLEIAMRAGIVRSGDPGLVADWIARTLVSLVLDPATDDRLLEVALGPVLRPTADAPQPRRTKRIAIAR